MEFVYFGNDWFAENRTSSHHIATRLGVKFPLLYVESPGLRAPKVNTRDMRKLWNMLRRTFRPPQAIAPHLWVMTLPQIPLRRFRLVKAANRIFSRFVIRRAMKKLGFHRPVAWFHVPHPGFLAGQLDDVLTIYYCVDDYSMLPDVDSAIIQKMDVQLTAIADIVFVSSQHLLESHKPINGNIYLSPHGVDAEAFARASAVETQIPTEAAGLSHPIVGFWGLLERWVDLSILEYIAQARPQWTVLLIGRVAVDVSALRRHSNVVFSGTIPYSELPRWAKAIDVCILPFLVNSLILPSSPLKLREYLAAGKPTVSVPLPDVQQFSDVVITASGGPGFVHAIEQALATNNPRLEVLRKMAVAEVTWDSTVTTILEKLDAHLQLQSHP